MYIALDFDGVIANTRKKFLEVYNLLKKKNKTMADLDVYDIYEDWGITEKEFWILFEMVQNEKVEQVDKKASKYIKKLAEEHTIDIVTARLEKERGYIEKTLERYKIYPGEHYRKIVIVDRAIQTNKLELGYDLYIDDNPFLAKDIQENFEDTRSKMLLWDWPWNWKIESKHGVKRVSSWKDIMKYFSNL